MRSPVQVQAALPLTVARPTVRQPLWVTSWITLHGENTGGVAATALNETGLVAPFNFVGGAYPGTGGTCGATLSSGSSCTLVVRYAPAASGVANGGINLGYYNGAATVAATRAVTGAGTLPAVITISELDPYSYGTRPTGSVTNHTFTIANAGGSTATALVGGASLRPLLGWCIPWYWRYLRCELGRGLNCTIVVSYAQWRSAAPTTTPSRSTGDGVNNRRPCAI